ncbi:serine/threonine protein kinase ppk15, putative [Entamoeba dispar SAW760]|uniref:Serine/threonine protein kinase ppk15, putative n=1 Tax=Entamoeba dispar (strain ATCC PRA-260 / SAW760) TaxID=370354 RepID=B0ETH8_ENTDS|nr:serine/threonine protein kinase ppk15, putative [Entamoeba dispar SAW760]EDR22163.1 serine/threonine protein kinase ppk15, putative [Entamoeba dispar SAW760]|eukprot:EDR22163.1 serine/threonine protein kinase ppk15, putative [Entamoeba dispar SAW760]
MNERSDFKRIEIIPLSNQSSPKTFGITKQLTTSILTTFNRCLPNEELIITSPSIPMLNQQRDNEINDLIIRKGDIIGTFTSLEGPECSMDISKLTKYRVIEPLGQGTFGQVFKCVDLLDKEKEVAIKILKNHTAYFRQGLIEVSVLMILNTFYDQGQNNKILTMKDHFMYYNHICIVTELLGKDLYHLMKENKNKGFSIRTIRKFLFQLLRALRTLSHANIVHCDVKPENILLQGATSNIKLIDFGSACFENFTMNTYIQSRHYRAPEIVLGLPYSCAIDMWSVGCIAAEFFLGIPLFAGTSEYNLLFKMIDMLGMLPNEMLKNGTRTKEFFNLKNGVYEFKEQFQYEAEKNIRLTPNRHYFSYHALKDLIEKNPMKVGSSEVDEVKEIRASLYDFLLRCFVYNPKDRLTPDQALAHPFIIGTTIEGYEIPLREVPYKEYGKVMTMKGKEYINRVFNGIEENICDNQMYYKVFMHALYNGHIVNVLTESPYVGSITPESFIKIFNEKCGFPKKLQTMKSITPRQVKVVIIDEGKQEFSSSTESPNSGSKSSSPQLDNEKEKRKSKVGKIKDLFRKLTPSHSPRVSPRFSPKISPRSSFNSSHGSSSNGSNSPNSTSTDDRSQQLVPELINEPHTNKLSIVSLRINESTSDSDGEKQKKKIHIDISSSSNEKKKKKDKKKK